MSLKNKVVLVTGGSSGIGANIAEKATEEGANVAIVGRNETKLNDVSAQCEKLGKKPLVIVADLTNSNYVKRVIESTLNEFGKLDVLVNNAGFGSVQSFLDENAMETFDKISNLNLRATVELTHLAAPHIIETKGNIINISSGASIKPIPSLWAYCIAKAGLNHFTRILALDLAPKGVRVNTVSPGPVRTDFVSNMGVEEVDGIYENMKSKTALGRVSKSSEVGDLVVYLAGDKALGITGSNFVLDNGALLL